MAEPFSAKLQARIAPYVGLSIIIGILVMIVVIAVKEAPLRGQVLTLAGTLGGAVTGYYFGGKHSAP